MTLPLLLTWREFFLKKSFSFNNLITLQLSLITSIFLVLFFPAFFSMHKRVLGQQYREVALELAQVALIDLIGLISSC